MAKNVKKGGKGETPNPRAARDEKREKKGEGKFKSKAGKIK